MLLKSTIWFKMLTEADYLVLLGRIKHILFGFYSQIQIQKQKGKKGGCK